MPTQSQSQCERSYIKEQIPRSTREVLRLLHASNLQNDVIDYLYFKIDRIEHILAVSLQVVDIEYSGCFPLNQNFRKRKWNALVRLEIDF